MWFLLRMKNHFEISIIFRCIITLIRLNEKNLCCSFISRIWMLFESIIFHRREKNLKHNIEERFCYMSLLLSRATDSCARRILLLIRLCTTQIEVIQIHAKVLHHPSECWEWYIINYLIENRDLLDIINNNQIITTQRFNSYQLIMLFSLALWKYAGIGKCGGGWKWNVKIVSTFSFAHTPIHTYAHTAIRSFRSNTLRSWFRYSALFVRELDYNIYVVVELSLSIHFPWM